MRINVGLSVPSFTTIRMTGTVVEADNAAPVVNSDSYTSATQTLALDITEASGSATLYGATVVNPNTPSKSDIENNTGTALDTFTQAITEGGGPYIITGLTDETANEIHYFLRDAAGNETAIRILTGVVVDNTITLSSAVLAADGVTLTLDYGETLAGTADAADYTVEADAVGVTVSTATRTGSTVVLGLAAAIDSGQTVTVSYTGTAIEDTFGNAAAALTDRAVTNNSTQGGASINRVAFSTDDHAALQGVSATNSVGYTLVCRAALTSAPGNNSTYFSGQSSSSFVLVANDSGSFTLRPRNAGGGIISTISTANVTTKGDLANIAFAVDVGGDIKTWVDGVEVDTRTNAATNVELPGFFNSAGFPGVFDMVCFAVYEDYLDPNTHWSSWFDGAGAPTTDLLNGNAVGGLTPTDYESGDAAAWNAKYSVTTTDV